MKNSTNLGQTARCRCCVKSLCAETQQSYAKKGRRSINTNNNRNNHNEKNGVYNLQSKHKRRSFLFTFNNISSEVCCVLAVFGKSCRSPSSSLLKPPKNIPSKCCFKSDPLSRFKRPDVVNTEEWMGKLSGRPLLNAAHRRRTALDTEGVKMLLVCKQKKTWLHLPLSARKKNVILTYLSLVSHCNPPSTPSPSPLPHPSDLLPPPFAMTSRRL